MSADVNVPNPGSDAAYDAGCRCPRLDNGRGRRTDDRWVIVVGCPVHHPEEDR